MANFCWGRIGKRSTTIVLISLLMGCGTHSNMDDQVLGAAGSSSRMTITIMHPYYNNQKVERSTAWEYMEYKFDMHYKPIQISTDSYSPKLRAAVAKGNIADIVVWTSNQSELVQYVRSGRFHDLTPYIEKSPNLSRISEDIWNNASIDDKHYGIPRPRALVDLAVYIRKDWLDQLQLPLPVTIEDYYETAVKFGQGDPDNNGKADTYGFGAGEALSFLTEIYHAFGAGNTWIVQQDGTLLADRVSPGRELALRWLRELYPERGIDEQFSVLKPTQVWKRFTAGYTGILIAPISDFYQYQRELVEQDPGAQLVMLGPPVGPTGIAGFSERIGYYGQLLVSSEVSEEKLDRIVSFLDWQSSEEGYHLRRFGLEGIHYKVQEDGALQINPGLIEGDALSTLLLMNPYDPYMYVSSFAPSTIQQQQREALDQVRGKGIRNPAINFISDTGLSIGSIYTKKIQQFETNFVKGILPETAFGDFREEFLAKGGEKMSQEVNAWYSSLHDGMITP